MGRKIFYNHKKKTRKWLQTYKVWLISYAIILIFIAFLGVEKRSIIQIPNTIKAIKTNLSKQYNHSGLIFFRDFQSKFYKKQNLQCGGVLFERGSGRRIQLIFDVNSPAALQLALVALENLQEYSLSKNLQIILENTEKCSQELNFSYGDFAIRISDNNFPLVSNGSLGSQNWQNLFPYETHNLFLNQFISLALPISPWDNMISEKVAQHFINANNYRTPKEQIQWINSVQYLKNISIETLKNKSIWLNDQYALTKTSWRWIIMWLIFLNWLPLFHRLILTNEKIELTPAILNILLYSIIPTSLFLLTHFSHPKLSLLFLVLFLAIFLTWFIRRQMKLAFILEANLTTKLFLWAALTSLCAIFLNPSFAVLLLPVGFLMSRTTSYYLINLILATIALIPFFSAFVIKIIDIDQKIRLPSVWLASSFIPTVNFFIIILTATILMFIKKEKHLTRRMMQK